MKGIVVIGVPISMGMLVSIAICAYAVARYYYPVLQSYFF